jgi:hypothetical protein
VCVCVCVCVCACMHAYMHINKFTCSTYKDCNKEFGVTASASELSL